MEGREPPHVTNDRVVDSALFPLSVTKEPLGIVAIPGVLGPKTLHSGRNSAGDDLCAHPNSPTTKDIVEVSDAYPSVVFRCLGVSNSRRQPRSAPDVAVINEDVNQGHDLAGDTSAQSHSSPTVSTTATRRQSDARRVGGIRLLGGSRLDPEVLERCEDLFASLQRQVLEEHVAKRSRN